ncbi:MULTISPECIES: 3-isopropylmalate dehydrogenase [unclassified Tenacibaculum]|uniref:3-isopropylmalate dehydrogenase n=1 Tax=unclassified Tenacibaculum TaxID=2635139 RepID=UPI001F2DCFBB|nr:MULTISPECIES: 3-isopropylmalate dehydrogenase [unclassified Tenacibaculum]MCF2876445.1 3-isopropylmalate dehydrogenase [Tenacibaculum sp. Cn5-1]MCF2936412.1 3-isopropylmalate dehydrogenase [Tenacibaculum sp. Cn5-34]MCG7512863.1 3-isopropylmalate dehydrogenase [Tenacibaculum sp. Cn5-46]
MKYNIAVIPGDGIGPEVTEQAKKALNAIAHVYDHTFIYKEALMGACAIDETGNPLPNETLSVCKESDAILFGAIGHPKYDNDPSAKVRPEQGLLKLRKELGLFCNVRPVKAYDQLIENSPLKEDIIKNTDISIYRELTGGIYFGIKELSDDGKIAFDGCSYSVEEIERIAHLAFKEAQNRSKKLTLVDKANVLETSRLWRKTVTALSSQYPEVTLDFLFVDNAAMQMILNPKQFDVILTENLFGDIISDEASVIGGSIGLLASASVGKENALFEPIHGSFPQATGKDIANPLASILSAAMLLKHLGLHTEAAAVERAVEKSLELGITTEDISSETSFGTSKVGDFIVDYIYNQEDSNLNFQNIHMGQSTII